MMDGIVFDIKEMTLNDGPGLRTTVFFKGCPLCCTWCHNPEGQSHTPEYMAGHHSERLAGVSYTTSELAEIIMKNRNIFELSGGGVTFSGGEPAEQADFLLELIERLPGIHKCMETSGFCPNSVFRTLIGALDSVFMDVKIFDSQCHKQYTGADNQLILRNLETLTQMDTPYIIRIPLIPTITDTTENLSAIAEYLAGLELHNCQRVELLPYHLTAGAKYKMLNRAYNPGFDVNLKPRQDVSAFLDRGIPAIIL